MTLENIRFFEKQIAAIDKAIARELAAFPGSTGLAFRPGLGPVFVAGIIAEVRDINRFDTDAQLPGLHPSSGRKAKAGSLAPMKPR